MKKNEMSVKEFVWCCIATLIAVFGIILMVFGIIGDHIGGPLSQNFIKNAEANFPLNFRIWGVIFVLIGVAVLVIVLCVFARKADRELERTVRRQQRLASANAEAAVGVKSAVEVVEAEKPAEAE